MLINKETGEITSPFIRTAFNYDTDNASEQSALHCLDKSLTVQSERDETDINEIVRRFGITGTLPNNVNPPQYGDFTEIHDYRSALQAVREASENFMELPADLRSRFQNDPAQLLDFLANEKNREEATTLGLINQLPKDLTQATTLEQTPPTSPTTS